MSSRGQPLSMWPSRTGRRPIATTLLAAEPDGWSNLGDWSGADANDYPGACRRLALRVGNAAHIGAGARVLDLGCGAGASLRLWREHFGAARCDGIEAQPALAALALAHGTVIHGAVPDALAHLGPEAYDAIVSVDAAYHFGSLAELVTALIPRLVPGGSLALTTFAWSGAAPTGALGLGVRAVLAAAAIDSAAIVPLGDLEGHGQPFGPSAGGHGQPFGPSAGGHGQPFGPSAGGLLARAGLEHAHVERCDHDVLDGFASFVARRRAELPLAARLTPGWAKIALTARACQRLVASGLAHYVLIAASRPQRSERMSVVSI